MLHGISFKYWKSEKRGLREAKRKGDLRVWFGFSSPLL
jgi:hypothetical protein